MVTSTVVLHVAMLPWFATGHITPFVTLSNKLAEKGHKISLFIPAKTQNKFNHLNLHPHLIQFIPVTVPHVDGLPSGAETMSDISLDKFNFLQHAFDLTQDEVEVAFRSLKPNFVIYDFAYWIPKIAHPLGIKAIFFSTCGAIPLLSFVPSMMTPADDHQRLELLPVPEIYPCSSSAKLLPYETKNSGIDALTEYNGRISIVMRVFTAMTESDILCFRCCKEMENPYLNYLQSHYNDKPVLAIGPLLSSDTSTILEERWANWLGCFEKGSVVYCAFGSECVLEKNQFQELVLGLEKTGFPFLVRLRPPFGAETLEEALPEGFQERVRGRGVVHERWVQQKLILSHPSVGCFVSHCGFGSVWDSLMSTCQIVLVPQSSDQFIQTKFLTKGLKVAVNVERREEDGWYTKEDVCKAVKLVMDEGSEVGEEVRANHIKLRQEFLVEGFESSYIDNFINKLQDHCHA
ncbi:Glycosyltransferase [Thalictrum thalictroides]|uniref:Glycosyltransferase n=1 Tax=Thalictrum thalictroides TaxID=46969 RepID=A0A7J6W3I6_THATH|nr:Glycosyltransferase [Thalictrum thalictroides]